LLQSRPVIPAEPEDGAVVEREIEIPVTVGDDVANAVDFDDG
jgi:hypothetical protein